VITVEYRLQINPAKSRGLEGIINPCVQWPVSHIVLNITSLSEGPNFPLLQYKGRRLRSIRKRIKFAF